MTSRTNKFRGSRTHGGGYKAHRGHGKRGGTGNAGLHKHKWIYTVKYMPGYFGAHGFKRPQKVVCEKLTMNVCDLDKGIERLVSQGKATLVGDAYTVDLGALGIDKLLGKGHATRKFNVKVAEASQSAISKIEEAGGKVETEAKAAEPAPKSEKK